jgi:hypothetical protein
MTLGLGIFTVTNISLPDFGIFFARAITATTELLILDSPQAHHKASHQ